MPSLVLCSKRTPFSGDDLRFFCICECLFRILQLVLGLALIGSASLQKNHFENLEESVQLQCDLNSDFSSLASDGVAVLYAHASVTIFLAIIGMGTAIPTLLISMKGTPTNAEPRKALLKLCYFNLSVMNIFRITGFVLALFTTTIFKDYCACLEEEIRWMGNNKSTKACPGASAMFSVLIALIFTNVLDAGVAITQTMYFVCSVSYCPTVLPSESKWKGLLTCCIGCSSTMTCCLFGGFEALQGDFGDLATIISNYTNNNQTLDITVSDIAAGLIMVVRWQREALLEARERVRSSFADSNEADQIHSTLPNPVRRYSDPYHGGAREQFHRVLKRMGSTPELHRSQSAIGVSDSEMQISSWQVLAKENYQDKLRIAEAARFMPLAQGMYTWIIYLVEHPLVGFFRLGYLILRRCACFCPTPKDKLRHDFPWEPHMIAFQEISGLDAEDIVFASFKESIIALPYVVALDHPWKSVVIAIRGTLSMESVLADIAIRPEDLTSVGAKHGFDGDRKYCHRGILRSSEWIYADLVKHGKLKELFDGEYKNYRLVVVGHSLGAGCAAMLSVMLRPVYPNLRCLAFGVPGSVFSENLAEECSSWLTSYVLDADVIPRLAIRQFEVLRDGVLGMICRIKVPKCDVFSLEKSSSKDRAELADARKRILYDEDEVPDSEFKRQLEKFFCFQDELKQKSETSGHYIDLFPPGKIIQLFRTRNQGRRAFSRFLSVSSSEGTDTRGNETSYVARWIQRTDLHQIILSSHMINDHEPGNMRRKIQDFAETVFELRSPEYKIFQETT